MFELSERAKVVRETTQYHETLNPAIWTGLEIKTHIREALLKVAKHFTSKLFEKNPQLLRGGILISDVILTGSNANYNWTAYSDFDVHIVIDYLDQNTDKTQTIKYLFDLQRRLWNKTHEVRVAGYPVEMYFQDSTETHISSGVFSLKYNTWTLIPVKSVPTLDKKEIETKWKAFRDLIHAAVSEEELRVAYEKIIQMRKTGLESAGEFSTENLVFKVLRNAGHIQTLIEKLQRLENTTLSAD